MNAKKRKIINGITKRLEELRDQIISIMDEEQECFDNLSDGLRQTERGQSIAECAAALEDAEFQLDDVILALEDIIGTY